MSSFPLELSQLDYHQLDYHQLEGEDDAAPGSNGEPDNGLAPSSDLVPGRNEGLAIDGATDSGGVLGIDGPSDSDDKPGNDGSAGSDGIAIGAMLGDTSSDGIAMGASIPGEASTDGIARGEEAPMPVEPTSDGIERGGAPMPVEPSSDGALIPMPCANAPSGMNSMVSAHANKIDNFIANSPSFAWHPNCSRDFATLPLSGAAHGRERQMYQLRQLSRNSIIPSLKKSSFLKSILWPLESLTQFADPCIRTFSIAHCKNSMV